LAELSILLIHFGVFEFEVFGNALPHDAF
jgi:hypothetical protein